MIGDDGVQLGVMPTREALERAQAAGLDLVEISPRAVPPVCRIMDYGKFKFDEAKKKSEARKRQVVIETKEIKLRPKTGGHDYQFKLRHIRRFLAEGNRVRLVIQFRGREIVHPETGRKVLNQLMVDLADVARMEQVPLMEGRFMVAIVAPRPGAAAPPPTPPAPTLPR